MSLFVGNVSKHVSHRQLQNLFKTYGKCRIDLRDRYAFVQFDVDKHAEQAKKQLQHQAFHGLELNIQWSKNSGRFGQNKGGRKDGQRKRSRSRQNRWRRDDRWTRRSPSFQRRSSPSYSGNKDFQTFVPQCQRDQMQFLILQAKNIRILKKLLEKKQQHIKKHKTDKDHINTGIHMRNLNNIMESQIKIVREEQLQAGEHVEIIINRIYEERVPEDGQIDAIREE